MVYKYDWLPTLKRLALSKIRIHDLRHGVATLELEAGLPLKFVAGILGHSSMSITADMKQIVDECYGGKSGASATAQRASAFASG